MSTLKGNKRAISIKTWGYAVYGVVKGGLSKLRYAAL
jgi:hypothetical protein